MKSGYLHPAGDAGGLVQGVLNFTASRETSLTMGAHGQQVCRATLHTSRTSAQLLQKYTTRTRHNGR